MTDEKKPPMSKDEQDYYRGTMRMILAHLLEKPDTNWTQFIYSRLRGRTMADYRKTLQILKQMEFDGLLTKKKNAINNYEWAMTEEGTKKATELESK